MKILNSFTSTSAKVTKRDKERLENFCESLHSEPDVDKIVDNIESNKKDFEVDNVRWIRDSHILKSMMEQFEGEHYTLGAFNANFLAEYTPRLDMYDIKEMQDNDECEEIGKMISKVHFRKMMQDALRLSGEGHFFNYYDGNSEEIKIGGIDWFVFDNR